MTHPFMAGVEALSVDPVELAHAAREIPSGVSMTKW